MTEWTINPSYSARFGSHFESLVKSSKKALHKALTFYRTLTEEEFGVAIAKTEQIVNSRPLNLMSNDPSDEVPLCPYDFLGTGPRFRDLIPLTARDNATRYGGKIRNLLKKMWEDFHKQSF